MAHIVVIGAGVIGLQTTLTLLEAGYKVSVVAEYLPGDEDAMYTSPWAGAISRSHATAEQSEMCEWDMLSYEMWMKVIHEDGKRARDMGLEGSKICVYSSRPAEPQDKTTWFASRVRNFRTLSTSTLPPGPKGGISWDGVAINPPVYLAYLFSTIKSLGANVIKSSLPTDQGFPEALKALLRLMDHSNNGKVAAIVNCTGLGAARLCGDTKMFPSRGQTLLVKFSGETPDERISLYEDEGQNVAYAFPRPGTDIWLFGGTKTRGRWDTKPDDAVSEGILERCCKLLQCAAEDISVVATQVGLRPGRHGGPRVEIEEVDIGDEGVVNVVHEYGHGGAGYQNSIGSAGKVLGLLRGLLGEV